MYEERVYRKHIKSDSLFRTTLVEDETDLLIVTSEAFINHHKVADLRSIIKDYIKVQPEFQTSLEPVKADAFAPELIQHMMAASKSAQVGPMATVAGAIAHYTGESLPKNDEIMIVFD